MKYLFFLLIIPFLLIPNAYAQTINEIDEGPTYKKTLIGDDEFNIKLYPYERIFDGNEWIKYRFTNGPNEIIFEGGGGSFILDKNSCEFKLHEKGIIAGSAVIENYKAEYYLDNIKNPESCIIDSIDESGDSVKLSIIKDGLEIRFFLGVNNIEWFYDLNNDLGKQTTFRIIESCDNCTPDKIEDNKLYFNDYVLDTKDEQHQTLKSIQTNGKQIMIEFEKTLDDKETFEIDPVFGWTGNDDELRVYDLATSTSCQATVLGSDGVMTLNYSPSSGAGRCHPLTFQWDVSAIDDSATITDVQFRIDIDSATGAPTCQINEMDEDITTASDQDIWDALTAGDNYASSLTECNTTGNQKQIDLGPNAINNLEAKLTTTDLFAISLLKDPHSRDGTQYTMAVSDMELEVTYFITTTYGGGPPINPSATQTLDHLINFTWTPDNATGVIGYTIYNSSSQLADPWDWLKIAETGNFTGDTGFYEVSGLTFCSDMWLKTSAFSLTNGSNTTAVYGRAICGPPNAVDSLTSPDQTFSSIILNWDQPNLKGAPSVDGYQINFSDPASENPITIIVNDTGTSGTSYEIGSLSDGEYSFRVSVWTEGGNNATGNIINASTLAAVGAFSVNATNPDIIPIRFERTEVNSTQTDVNVIFSNTYDPFNCELNFDNAQESILFNELDSSVYDSDFNYSTFQIVNSTNDVITFNCYDVTTNETGKYVLTLSSGSIPLIEQVQGFQGGEYNTAGDFGALDLVTLLIVIVSMVGLNRVNQAAGVIISFMIMFGLAAFELIEIPTLLFGSIAVIIMLVVSSTRKP